MMRTEAAKSVAVITDNPGGMRFGSLDQKSRGGKRGGGRHGNRGLALPADMAHGAAG